MGCVSSLMSLKNYVSYGIVISYASPYHPQANSQDESSDKSIMKIIRRMLDIKKKAWDSKLKLALWADRIMVKKATRKSPFELVYGVEARISMHNLLLIYKFILKEGMDIPEPMEERMEKLAKLDEIRTWAQKRIE